MPVEERIGAAPVVFADTVTVLPEGVEGAVLVTGSHGGAYPAALAARARPCALVFHDAGVGREHAGIAALAVFEAIGRPAVAVAHDSARIGETADMMARGRVSFENGFAGAAGIRAGMPLAEAVSRLAEAGFDPVEDVPDKPSESRIVLRRGSGGRIAHADSAALVEPSDAGAVVVTGSHGGLIGGDPRKALKVDAYAAVFNDAGIGIDGAGIRRLAALDLRGIAAVTVAAASARIGDARSACRTGVVSRVNRRAAALGAVEGAAMAALAERWADSAAAARQPGPRST